MRGEWEARAVAAEDDCGCRIEAVAREELPAAHWVLPSSRACSPRLVTQRPVDYIYTPGQVLSSQALKVWEQEVQDILPYQIPPAMRY